MNRLSLLIAAALACPLAACGSEPSRPVDSPNAALESEIATAAESPAQSGDPARPALTPDAENGVTSARAVLLDFARAIELKRFDEAYNMLGQADRDRWGRAQFTGFLADLEEITVALPGGSMEGAAGSSYYTAPATITATGADGRRVRYSGEIVLRRVNDVPGATPEQLRWHIEQVSLDWTH